MIFTWYWLLLKFSTHFLLRFDTPYLDAKSLEEIYIGFHLAMFFCFKVSKKLLWPFFMPSYITVTLPLLVWPHFLTHTVAHSTRPLGLKPITSPFLCHMILYSCYLNMWTVKHLAPAFWTESKTWKSKTISKLHRCRFLSVFFKFFNKMTAQHFQFSR